MNRIIVALLVLVISQSVLSQRPRAGNFKKFIIEGVVLDKETQEYLEYATVSLINESFPNRIQGGITDTQGKFIFEVFPGKYNVTIEYIGFDKITLKDKVILTNENLGKFELEIAAESLNEIELIGERTEVEIRLDKRIYNVGKDITVRGGSVADVLDNVPSVSVDVEGNIALRGNENVRILINGREFKLQLRFL
jgi:hypothetical protein